MSFTTETSITTNTYTWSTDPDFFAEAVVNIDVADDPAISSFRVTGKDADGNEVYGLFFSNNSSLSALQDFITFLKGVATDLEPELNAGT